ncbi:MAG TPA: energy transducer TonB [Burkholderiales bacterium]|nr:energy transducer TonB [Burkholderiales bacterium]
MAAVLAGGYYANESGRRLLVWALAGSLCLHLFLLLVLPLLQEAQRTRLASLPLNARLVKPKPPDPAPPSIAPPTQSMARPRPVPAVKAAPQPAAEPIPSVEPSKPAAEPALVIPAAPAAPVARIEAQPASPAAAAGGPDPGSVARFRLELMDLARRYKRYPRIAQDNGWEGRVEVRIAIGEDGAISSLTVKKGAGRAVLDDEAQAMIRAAKSQAAIPPGLRGKAFTLEIPVDFFLKEER